jgi:hypothetical protein
MQRQAVISAGAAINVAALFWSTAFIADVFDHQPASGDPLVPARKASLATFK